NRHAFYSLVEDARRQGSTPPEGTVALVDIDSLKPINDAYGHAAGDESIRAVATAIRSIVRAADLVIRWGGDEFLVILIGLPGSGTTGRSSTRLPPRDRPPTSVAPGWRASSRARSVPWPSGPSGRIRPGPGR